MNPGLDEIVRRKKADLELLVDRFPVEALQKRIESVTAARDFEGSLRSAGGVGLIAEAKRASPSAGPIRDPYGVAGIASAYESAGAAALSVLTEEHFFKGRTAHLMEAKTAAALPVLRKDFIVDPYQIYEARAFGADAVLLIAALLGDRQIKAFLELSRKLGLAALVETHDEKEIERALACGARVVGVNSRNLRDLSVDPGAFQRLMPLIPKTVVRVAESGIKTPEDMKALRELGVNAALVGESLLQQKDLEKAARTLVEAGRGEKKGVARAGQN